MNKEIEKTATFVDLLTQNDTNNDIFVSGNCHKVYLKSKITNTQFLNYKLIDKHYTIDFSSLNRYNYWFIEQFYTDIGLNLTQYFDYFYLPDNINSKQLYDSVRNYYLVFIQYKSSTGETLNISNLINKYKNDDKVLLICNDANLYNKNSTKYELAETFVLNKLIYYVDVIKNSDEIYIIDSCFTGIILPFVKTNKLKTNKVQIILREEVNKYVI